MKNILESYELMLLSILKRESQKQMNVLTNFIKPRTTRTSREIAPMLVKKRSYRNGEVVNQCAIKIAHDFGKD